MKSYLTVETKSEGIYEEKRSKFLAKVFHVENQDEAKNIILNVKKEYYDARHNCYAYIIGEDKKQQKFFDDGEPSGTAGAPIMDAINKKDLTNVLITVTRYFGGIKLGAAGLTRAYNKAANTALENAKIIKMESFFEIKLTLDYSLLSGLEYYLRKENIKTKTSDYNEKVALNILVLKDKLESVKKDITELSAGKILTEDIGEESVAVDI